MKKLFLLIMSLFALSSVSAFANTIATCTSVEHHGSYIDFEIENNKLDITISDDSDHEDKLTHITVDSGQGTINSSSGQSWAIRKSVKKLSTDGFGLVIVKAKAGATDILININSRTNSIYLVMGDYVQAMTCQAN